MSQDPKKPYTSSADYMASKFYEHFPQADPVHQPKKFQYYLRLFGWLVKENKIDL